MWNLSAVATAFDEAAKDGSKWNAAMEAVAAATASARAVLLAVPQGEPPILREHAGGWAQRILDSRHVSKLLRDQLISDTDYTHEEIKCSRPYGASPEAESLPWFAGVKITADDEFWCLLIQRSIKQGPFSAAELKELANLSPVLSQAASEARLRGLARADGALTVFGLLKLPAVLLDRYGQLIKMNQVAGHLFGDEVVINRGHVRSFDHDTTMTLSLALQEFMSSGASSVIMPIVPLPRRRGGRPLLASAIRLSTISQDIFAPCQAILIFFDLEEHPQPSEAVLREAFGLSAAEARLARGLASGESLNSLAEHLKISKLTARHELKSVFAKLNVHRQSELVALLNLLPR